MRSRRLRISRFLRLALMFISILSLLLNVEGSVMFIENVVLDGRERRVMLMASVGSAFEVISVGVGRRGAI